MATLKNPPQHLSELLDNLSEVSQLIGIHEAIAGTGPGRKRHVEVLNKSAIVLVVACWEAFVEDLAKAGLEHLIKHAKDHTIFPKPVLDRVASKHSGIHAWDLAGSGWKTALNDNLREVLAKTTGALNTPRAPQIDELFEKTLGLKTLSGCWAWPGRSSAQSIAALDQLVTLRGSIAHRVQHSRSVLKRDVNSAVELVSRLAAKSNNEVRRFILTRSNIQPWNVVRYKGMA